MTLKPFTATFSSGCLRFQYEVWTATAKAARESAELMRREDPLIPNDATITITPGINTVDRPGTV